MFELDEPLSANSAIIGQRREQILRTTILAARSRRRRRIAARSVGAALLLALAIVPVLHRASRVTGLNCRDQQD